MLPLPRCIGSLKVKTMLSATPTPKVPPVGLVAWTVGGVMSMLGGSVNVGI
jgi:hypothetical protein